VKDRYSPLRVCFITVFATGVAFAVLVLTRVLREFTQAGLEGRKFIQYYSLFLPSLWIILMAVVLASRNKPGTHSLWFWALAGAFAGYVGGLLSITFIELFRPDGWAQLVLQLHRSSSWVTRFGYPLVSLNWLIGLVAGMLGNSLNRYI
jgi:hypothetical protein